MVTAVRALGQITRERRFWGSVHARRCLALRQVSWLHQENFPGDSNFWAAPSLSLPLTHSHRFRAKLLDW